MRLPGFTAHLALSHPRDRHVARRNEGIERYTRDLVVPQFGFGPGRVQQFCDHDGCYLYLCNEVGCLPVNFSDF